MSRRVSQLVRPSFRLARSSLVSTGALPTSLLGNQLPVVAYGASVMASQTLSSTLGHGFAASGLMRTYFRSRDREPDYLQAMTPPANLGVLIVPQQMTYVVERFGKYLKTLDSGLHFLIPFVRSRAWASWHVVHAAVLGLHDHGR